MILIFILFCLVIGLINLRTNTIFTLILGIFGLFFFMNGNNIFLALQQLVTIPSIIFSNVGTMLLIVVMIELFVLSSLLNLINIDFIIDRHIHYYPEKVQKLIVIFLSLLSTNVDLTNSDIVEHYDEHYNLNSAVMPFVNPLSITSIFMSALLIQFASINGLKDLSVIFLVVVNIPAIWWLQKTLINLYFDISTNYKVSEKNISLIRPTVEVKQSHTVQLSLNGHRFIRRVLLIIAISIIPVIFIPLYRVGVYFVSLLGLLILYTVYLGVKAVYTERIMAEEQIYQTIRDSILAIGPEILSFVLVLIMTSNAYNFLNSYYSNSYSITQLYAIALLALVIGMLTFKDYLFGFAFALPITLIWITGNFAVNTESIEALYISFISIATLIQIFYFIDFNYVNKALIIDLAVLFIVTVTTLLALYFSNVEIAFTVFTIWGLIYIISLGIASNRKSV